MEEQNSTEYDELDEGPREIKDGEVGIGFFYNVGGGNLLWGLRYDKDKLTVEILDKCLYHVSNILSIHLRNEGIISDDSCDIPKDYKPLFTVLNGRVRRKSDLE